MKLTGDGALVEFGSAVDAVACACAIQEQLTSRNKGVPEDRQIRLRMGIDVGDVIIDDEDIYGTGVNVAARLQQLAEPDGIYVSESVAEYVRSIAQLTFEYVGQRQVKNIADPIQVDRVTSSPAGRRHPVRRRLHVLPPSRTLAASGAAIVLLAGLLAGGIFWTRGPEGPPLPEAPSVAVMPFDTFSPNPEQDYLDKGTTEDLITELSKVPDLFVIARNSTFAYADRPVSVRRIGEELGVRYVVEGSVRRSDTSIRIDAQLINAQTGRHVWAERYDRPLRELFEVQDSVTAAITGTLMGTTGVIADAEMARVSSQDPDNFGAYDYLMRGWEAWHKFTPEANREARQLFEKARQLDPDYARAYAAIAWTHALDTSTAGPTPTSRRSRRRCGWPRRRWRWIAATIAATGSWVGRRSTAGSTRRRWPATTAPASSIPRCRTDGRDGQPADLHRPARAGDRSDPRRHAAQSAARRLVSGISRLGLCGGRDAAEMHRYPGKGDRPRSAAGAALAAAADCGRLRAPRR